jgi:hypothetical protein
MMAVTGRRVTDRHAKVHDTRHHDLFADGSLVWGSHRFHHAVAPGAMVRYRMVYTWWNATEVVMHPVLTALLIATCLCLGAPAQAQDYRLDTLKDQALHDCVARRGVLAGPFCVCWVETWVGLWLYDDVLEYYLHGRSTKHVEDMVAEATRQCTEH